MPNGNTIAVISILLLWTSCESHIHFDSKKWKIEEHPELYPFRNKMLADIVNNDKLNGLNFSQVIDSLGQPFGFDVEKEMGLYYLIENDYGIDIDPVYTKYLILIMDDDSLVIDTQIFEWDKFQGVKINGLQQKLLSLSTIPWFVSSRTNPLITRTVRHL